MNLSPYKIQTFKPNKNQHNFDFGRPTDQQDPITSSQQAYQQQSQISQVDTSP